MSKVYVAYCCGCMSSDWVQFAGDNLESMKDKIVNDFESSVDEILIYENNKMVYPSIKVKYEGNAEFAFDGVTHKRNPTTGMAGESNA